MNVAEFIPQGSIRILNRVIVFVFARNLFALTGAELDVGNIVVLSDHIERRAVVISNLLIGDFAMEVHVMRQDKQLLDIVARYLRIQIFRIVPADIDHFADDGADEEQGGTVHTGHRDRR